MEAEKILTQLYQQAALRRRSLEQGLKINNQSKTRIAYRNGAADALELVIKSLGVWEEYLKWSEAQCKKV